MITIKKGKLQGNIEKVRARGLTQRFEKTLCKYVTIEFRFQRQIIINHVNQ